MQTIITKSLRDIFSKDVIFFVIKIALGAFILSAIFLWFLGGGLSSLIASYLSWIPWEWLQTSGAKIITFGLGYIIFIIMVSVLTSMYSEKLLIKLAKKHYPNVPVVGTPNVATSLLITLKSTVIFLILFILFIPFLFVPVLGQIAMLYLWSILIKNPTAYDVGTLFIKNKKELKAKTKKTRIVAMIASLFNYVPLLNAFAPIFAQILFLHHILGKQVR
jgi:MFS family permease